MSVTCHQPATARASDSGWQLGFAHFRGFVVVVCFLLMVAALGLTLLKKTIHHQLRDRIVSEINLRLSGSPFSCKLATANWVEGRGLSLRGLSIFNRGTGAAIASFDRIYVKSPFQLTEVLSGGPSIESVTIENAHVRCGQLPDGSRDIALLFQKLKCDDSVIEFDFPVRIRNSRLSVDEPASPLGQAIHVDGINLDHQRDPDHESRETLAGYVSTPLAGRLDIRFDIDKSTGVWNAQLAASRIEIDEHLTGFTAGLLGENVLVQSVRGQLALRAAVTGRLGQSELPGFRVVGNAANIQCLDPSLPHQIHSGSFEFEIDNRQAVIRNAQCQMGYGVARANIVVRDPLNDPRCRVSGTTTGYQLTERMVAWLPARMQRGWHQFQPQGILDARFDFSNLDGPWRKTVTATVRDGSISWYRFPFRISRCNGNIHVVDEHMSLDLTAVEAQQSILIRGEIDQPGEHWSGWMEGKCSGNIPINEKVLQAFDVRPELARTLRKFNANGYVSGSGRIERQPGSPVVNRHFEIELRQATVRHEHFNYPIFDVHGTMIVENDTTVFRQIRGMNNNGQVECNGTWDRTDGLNLKFLANTVPLDDELRQALPAQLQKTWNGLRPVGIVDQVDVDMVYRPGAEGLKIGVTVEIPVTTGRVSPVSIHPIWFPYEMREVTGEFAFEDQRIDIRHFAARHGRTTINAEGTGAWDEEQWRVRFSDVLASNIVLDEALTSALPESIAQGLDRIEFGGHLSMHGTIETWGAIEAEAHRSPAAGSPLLTTVPARANANVGWDLEFGLGQARAVIGIPVENANGALQLRGQLDHGQFNSIGTLTIDSMMVQGVQVTSVVAPVSLDNNLIGIGALAATGSGSEKAVSATGSVFGGYIECDGQLQLAGDNDYFVQAVLTDGKLSDFAIETSLQQQGFSGQAYAGLRLYGNATGSHSTRGNGYLQLRNAKIAEVPVMLALLNVLRIREPNRTAFDQGQMEFTVNGENIDFQKIELNGNALSLIGRGTVNMDREVDLDFYTMAGRNRWFIPVLTRLYQAGSQQVWWIEVDGSLDQPETRHEVLPGLNDSLKRLFPELAEDAG